MSNQILFVDDDTSLLSTMKRNLGLDYDIHTAEGAEAAVQVVETQGAFSVVVVDMQMPKLNGIQTIELLRKGMPDAVFVMLTGNQDQTTAIQAVNDGQVFRFLNKPCQVSEISAALAAAQKQHNLITAEKELLSGTLAGAINLMTDLIEMPADRQLDTGRMAEAIGELASRLSIQLGWEEKTAARVFLVGIAMLSKSEAEQFETLEPTSDEHQAIFTRLCKTSATMLSKIPRLGWIVDVLRAVPQASRYDVSSDRMEVAAVLLRVVFYWNFMTLKGLSPESTTSIIQQVMPGLNSKVIDALEYLPDNRDALTITRCLLRHLQPGMVLHDDITSASAGHLVSRGRRLTPPMIENLMRTPDLAGQRIAVIENSIPRSPSA